MHPQGPDELRLTGYTIIMREPIDGHEIPLFAGQPDPTITVIKTPAIGPNEHSVLTRGEFK